VAIIELYSKRQKRLRGDVPDVYTYDEIPQNLRVQIIHICNGTIGSKEECSRRDDIYQAYSRIVHILCTEYGLFDLVKPIHTPIGYSSIGVYEQLFNFFLKESDNDKVLDVVELAFSTIDKVVRHWNHLFHDASEAADQAIEELNQRFKEHGIGYQYLNGEIVRVDSELIHSEVVKPALRLLNRTGYEGVQEEFLAAHEHYRHNNNKEALVECLKSFESMMKVICDRHGWDYKAGATARPLIKVCFDNQLVPAFWQQNYTSLISMLESSIPTGRNKLAGHGQGSEPMEVPGYLTSYMLHMTAAAIVFLGEAEAHLE